MRKSKDRYRRVRRAVRKIKKYRMKGKVAERYLAAARRSVSA